jgi:polygalacturonase
MYVNAKDKWPDGTAVSEWFAKASCVDVNSLGKQYVITDHGVKLDSTLLQTVQIQAVIDKAAENGGGVVVIPNGTFLSGSLFFKPGTHLHLQKGAVLKGSDFIGDFKLIDTRMEGQNLKYFAALVNAIGCDGFTLSGEGSINGNGLRYWKQFWIRRKYNSQCTNLDEMRPRLVFVQGCNDVRLEGVRLMNSPFWTTHLYQCNRVKISGLYIFAPSAPVPAPSSDAIDIDVCTDVHINGCYFSVNDDAIALKGGKGPWAHKDTVNNGENRNIIIEDCTYGFCHSMLTCGSESLHNYNIVLRNCEVKNAARMLWLKMRPDTEQNYEYITVKGIRGNVHSMLYVKPWTQFFDLKGRKDMPYSRSSNVVLSNINLNCKVLFDVQKALDQYSLKDFTFKDIEVTASDRPEIHVDYVENFKLKNVKVNGQKVN